MTSYSIRWLGGAALSAALVVSGCHSEEQSPAEINTEVSFSPSPPQVGKAEIVLTAKDASGRPVNVNALQVEGNMNHAGMKPVFAELMSKGTGRYEGTMEFTMGGDWFLIVTGKLDDGRPVNETIDVPGVQRP